MNMYGPHALAITDTMTAQLAADLGYPVDVLLTYQAAYAVATSNAFTSDGSDGHFAWCINQLRRPDITDISVYDRRAIAQQADRRHMHGSASRVAVSRDIRGMIFRRPVTKPTKTQVTGATR
jgi:hypothetical protein